MTKSISELIKIAEEYETSLPELVVSFDVPVKKDICGWIDHTILKAEATEAQIRKLCTEASENKFAAVCVNPGRVPLCSEMLKNTDVAVCTVIGFPLGANPTEIKVAETKYSIEHGATEVDLVINIGEMRSSNYQYVFDEIKAIREAAGKNLVKVIFENCYLNQKEKILCCLMCQAAGIEFVKTSTGFGASGATVEDVELMRRVVGPKMGVKAAGGIRTYQDALKMIRAGADRIGTSAGVAITEESEK